MRDEHCRFVHVGSIDTVLANPAKAIQVKVLNDSVRRDKDKSRVIKVERNRIHCVRGYLQISNSFKRISTEDVNVFVVDCAQVLPAG